MYNKNQIDIYGKIKNKEEINQMNYKEQEINGLTVQQVKFRKAQGQSNIENKVVTKHYYTIFFENIFTLFNFINLLLFIILLVLGSYKNTLFMSVIFFNTIIGIIQEIRAKITVEKLSLLSSKTAAVIRGGIKVQIPINEIVIDDILVLERGNQISSDSVIINGECSVNESLLTGESKPIIKKEGSILLSGSFLSSGKCIAKVLKVGKENYVSSICQKVQYINKNKSEIMSTLKKIIRINSVFIVPVGIMLLYNQLSLDNANVHDAVAGTVAALIGMIPEGLVLLTSTVLAVAVLRLSRRKVLVQELHCIETLARVDTLCLDKTGTITCDKLELKEIIPIHNTPISEIKISLSTLSKASEDNNSTINCIRDFFKNYETERFMKFIPFSSESKWSGITLWNRVTYALGAGEYILKGRYQQIKDIVDTYSGEYRVLTLVRVEEPLNFNRLHVQAHPIALVLIKDKIRKNAKKTIDYFKAQGVKIKVISGDSVKTVQNIAESVGIKNAGSAIDASVLTSDKDLYSAAGKYTVFGRATPGQKHKIIKAFKKSGERVAMVGDGVNDVLALKEADCSISFASGSEAARNISQLVLLNNDFSSMPYIVAEGRRAVNNIQRSASLFLVKTIFSTLMSILFTFVVFSYPFTPIQMSLISILTIGFPSFVLALEQNNSKICGKFFYNVISKSAPCALTMLINILLILFISRLTGLYEIEISTLSVLSTALCGMILLWEISEPFDFTRQLMFIAICSCLVLGFTAFRTFFELSIKSLSGLIIAAALVPASVFIWNLMNLIFKFIFQDKIAR